MLALFRLLDRFPQWLAAFTLIALVATLASGHVVRGTSAPLAEKTGFKLVDLQFAGWFPLLSQIPSANRSINTALASVGFETHSATQILDAWRKSGVLGAARRAQVADFFFAAAYGVFALLLACALWRNRPEDPRHLRWVRLVALGAVAALLDEVENLAIWAALRGHGEPAAIGLILPAAAATLKFVLLIVALVGFVVSLVRAHNASPVSGETPGDAPGQGPAALA